MNQNITDQTIALAAIIQSTTSVDAIATTGISNTYHDKPLIYSLFQTNPQTTTDVYNDLALLKPGLQILATNMMKAASPNALKYFATIINLQKKLDRREDLLQILSHGIATTEKRLEHFPLDHDNILASFADLYIQTVSKLTPRIMVKGESQYLNQENNKNRIRTLLLAGIRSSMLWRQKGGSQLSLLISHKKIIESAKEIINQLN